MGRSSGRLRRRAGAAALAAVVLALTACTVGPSVRPPVAVRGENVPAPPPAVGAPQAPDTYPELVPQQAALPFRTCSAQQLAELTAPVPAGFQLECADLPVMADPLQPTSGTALVSVVRTGPAGGRLDRPPLLVLGDTAGGGGAGHALEVAAGMSPAIFSTYTVIGMDRRGTGADALYCAPALARAALVDAPPNATGLPALTRLRTNAEEIVLRCSLDQPSTLGAYRSASTAADVELLRSALGVPVLAAVGAGDAAGALASWASDHPDRVARLVLDGPPDVNVDEPDATIARAATTEAAFDAFVLECSAPGTCPLGADPRATVTALVTQLTAQPLATADGRRLTAGTLITALVDGLGDPSGWPVLAQAIATAGTGDPNPVLALLEPYTSDTGTFDGRLAVACNDRRTRVDPPRVSQIAAEIAAEHPLFGGHLAQRLIACLPWGTGGPTATTGSADGLPPALVIGTAADPRTPLEESRAVANRLPDAAFVSWQGAGTGAYPRTACVTGVVDRLLLQGQIPESGALCPP